MNEHNFLEYPELNFFEYLGYIPFEYPEHKEYPKPAKEYAGFQWNPVPTINAPNMANSEYEIKLACAAYRAGVMPLLLK